MKYRGVSCCRVFENSSFSQDPSLLLKVRDMFWDQPYECSALQQLCCETQEYHFMNLGGIRA